jgi:phosphatidylserine synthase
MMDEGFSRVICYLYWAVLRLNKYESKRDDEFIQWKAACLVNLAIGLVYAPFVILAMKAYSVSIHNPVFLLIIIIWCGLQALLVHHIALRKFPKHEMSFLMLQEPQKRKLDLISILVAVLLACWFYIGLTVLS